MRTLSLSALKARLLIKGKRFSSSSSSAGILTEKKRKN
jgi:hypothetical protein